MLSKESLTMGFVALCMIASGFFLLAHSYTEGGFDISCAIIGAGLLALLAPVLCDENCGLIELYYRNKR